MNTFRTIIVPSQLAPTVRGLTGMITGEDQAEWMWTTPLSPTWELPVTHYISSGIINSDFADIVPCYWDIEWVWGKVYDGQAEYVANATGTPKSQIEWMFSMLDISEQSAQEAMDRLGLKLTIWSNETDSSNG